MVSEKGQVSFVMMRPGIKSLSPDKEDRSFMELNPLLIVGACERLSSWAGDVENIAIGYKKVTMYLLRHQGQVLALTIEKGTQPEADNEVINAIGPSLRALMA